MINAISEGPLRAAVKIDPSAVIHERQDTEAKAQEVRQARPVENAEASDKSGSNEAQEKSTSKYILDDNTIVFEKYNKDGELVYRLPPSYKPVNERA